MSAPARRIGYRLVDGALAVDPAALGGGLDHGVLAGDVVGGHRQVEGRRGPRHDVEVAERRLHHDDVGALGQVERASRSASRALAGSCW